MKTLLTPIFRSFYIPLVLFFYLILLYPFKKSYKKRLVKALEQCGPVFIKCGQSISLKPYLFSKETIEACSNLQDKVSPVKINLKHELGAYFEDFIFESTKPIASGSIACVFKAKLQTGENVAVKILRPNASQLIIADVYLLKVASIILEFIPVFKRLKIKAIVKNIEETLLQEINFKQEEENLLKIKANSMKIHEKIRTPKIFRKFTECNLLVTEFVTGFPLSNLEAIQKAGLSRRKIAKNLIEIYLEQVYEDGFFHADFHPGNLFVNQNYQITLIDFGIVSTISYKDRIVIAKILNGFLLKDYNQVLKAHIEGNYITETADLKAFKIDLEKIGDAFIHSRNIKQFSISGILMELFRIMENYKIEVKEDLLLLYKTIFFVEAVVLKLEPEYNIWDTIKPWMEKWKDRNLSVKAEIKRKIISFIECLTNFYKL